MRWPFSKKRKKIELEQLNEEAEQQKKQDDMIASIFFQTIFDRRKEDPLVGAKLGAKEIVSRAKEALKDKDGRLHIESLLCFIGALAGYSCQASVRYEFIRKKGLSENDVFMVADCNNGHKYYFGDLLNKFLIENQFSVWSLSAGMAQSLGVKKIPDINEILKYVTSTVGSDRFGIPRISEEHQPGALPCAFLKNCWPVFLPVVKRYCPEDEFATEWPILFGLAVQEVIMYGKDILDPLLALSIVMECAVPMSKVDFDSL